MTVGVTSRNANARLASALGSDGTHDDAAAAAWVDGFGIAAPDVVRYAEVLREVPDAIPVAMRNVAASAGAPAIDGDTATLLGLLVGSHRPRHVLELGTGVGLVTLQLARSVDADCTITSLERDPLRQEQAHAFLERDRPRCAVELRLGEPLRVLREGTTRAAWDVVVLTDPQLPRVELFDAVASCIAPGGLLVIPWALRGGRVADNEAAWGGDPAVEEQRLLNRCVATDPRFADVVLVPVGDGLLLARRR